MSMYYVEYLQWVLTTLHTQLILNPSRIGFAWYVCMYVPNVCAGNECSLVQPLHSSDSVIPPLVRPLDLTR